MTVGVSSTGVSTSGASTAGASTTGASTVGVFDSGVGGLSVLRAIRAEQPHTPLIYMADSAHAPYGERDAAYILDRCEHMVRWLLDQNVQAIVMACNTATVVAATQLRAWCPVPIVAMEPAIKPAALATQSGVVGVLATTQTVASAGVARLLADFGAGKDIRLQACSGWVECVERGDLTSAATVALLQQYLRPLLAAGADTLVLGCTHYPFLLPAIRGIVGNEIRIIDPAAAVARELSRQLSTQIYKSNPPVNTDLSAHKPVNKLVNTSDATKALASIRFLSSKPATQAAPLISALWGETLVVESF